MEKGTMKKKGKKYNNTLFLLTELPIDLNSLINPFVIFNL
jgi:hypothetical protein